MARCLDRLKRPEEAAKLYTEALRSRKTIRISTIARASRLPETPPRWPQKGEALQSYSEIASGAWAIPGSRRGG